MSEPYLYESLQSDHHFRLLRVSRDANGTILGELQNFGLTGRAHPDFVSFSYAWGDSTATRTIKLHGHEFAILESVCCLLGLVCDGNGFKDNEWLWIDSICINQADLDERGLQVSLMGRIYRRASKTVVWLGEGTPETDAGMDFMEELAVNNSIFQRDYERTNGHRTPHINFGNREKWKSLAPVFNSTWWRRVWTLQEFIIAPRLELFCGTRSISRTKLKTALYSLWLCAPGASFVGTEESWGPAWNRRRLHQWYRHDLGRAEMGLVALMAYNSSCAATDPRDRIYGLLGLASDLDVMMVGEPTYTYDAAAIYIALVEAFVDTYNSLDIICFAGLFKGHMEAGHKTGLPGLPSWVPDWSVTREAYVTPLMVSQSGRDHIGNFRPLDTRELKDPTPVYFASGEKPPGITFSNDLLQLTCKGVLIDYIDGLGRPSFTQSESQINLSPLSTDGNHEEAEKERLLHTIVRTLVLNSQDRYLSKPAPSSFLKDLQTLARAVRSNEPIHNYASRRFTNWYNANKDLLIRGFTLEDICAGLEEPGANPENSLLVEIGNKLDRGLRISENTASVEEVDLSEEGFVQRLHDTKSAGRMGKRLCTTSGGHVVMGPRGAKKGDVVCVLYGCSVPVLLRRLKGKVQEGNVAEETVKMVEEVVMKDMEEEEQVEEGEGKKEEYKFVGECYVDGFMNGERLTRMEEEQEFVLR